MGKHRPRGECRICGEYKKLTFEHVPPGATFNKQAVRFVSVKDYIESGKHDNAMPWELEKIKGRISQRGRGDYYICEKCNNDTGSWYGNHYKRFVDALMYVLHQGIDSDFKSVILEMLDMRPLPIIKQVMTMFCDINEGLANSDHIKKYRVFMYMSKGGVQKTAPLSVMIHLGESEPVTVSEIVAVPIGFILYLDIPSGYTPIGTEISSFAQCDYDDVATINLALNVYESNTWLPTDFRSKEEIKATIDMSKKWQEKLD